MSNRKWKRIRRQLKPVLYRIDLEKRYGARPPRWRKLLAPLFPGPLDRWWTRWEREHRRKLRKAMKVTSHMMRG